jgi:hypothetical protein
MKLIYRSPTRLILALAILFSLPALACSIFKPTSPTPEANARETKLASDVEASLTANAQTQAAQVTLTPPPSPTLPLPPSPTEIPGPVLTPVPTRTPVAVESPLPSGPWVGEITFASDVTQDSQPINPGTVFKRGITQIYAIFPYSGFEQGMKITVYWAVNGQEFVSAVRTWEWDPSGTYTPSTSYTNNRQLDSGIWTFTIFANNKKLGSGSFKITN